MAPTADAGMRRWSSGNRSPYLTCFQRSRTALETQTFATRLMRDTFPPRQSTITRLDTKRADCSRDRSPGHTSASNFFSVLPRVICTESHNTDRT